MIRYFISFAHERGFGNLEIRRVEPFNDIEEIHAEERKLAENNGMQWVTFFSVQRLPL